MNGITVLFTNAPENYDYPYIVKAMEFALDKWSVQEVDDHQVIGTKITQTWREENENETE